MLTIYPIKTAYLDSWSYVLKDHDAAVIIDACPVSTIDQVLKKLSITKAILTHAHWDHSISAKYAQKRGIPILCSAPCAENLLDAKLNGSQYADEFCKLQTDLKCKMKIEAFSCLADETFEHERVICWEGHTIRLTETPGHTNGSICIDVDERYLFTGDTLFGYMPTNTRSITGSKNAFANITMPFLHSIGDRFAYPGHYESFALEQRLKKEEMR